MKYDSLATACTAPICGDTRDQEAVVQGTGRPELFGSGVLPYPRGLGEALGDAVQERVAEVQHPVLRLQTTAHLVRERPRLRVHAAVHLPPALLFALHSCLLKKIAEHPPLQQRAQGIYDTNAKGKGRSREVWWVVTKWRRQSVHNRSTSYWVLGLLGENWRGHVRMLCQHVFVRCLLVALFWTMRGDFMVL